MTTQSFRLTAVAAAVAAAFGAAPAGAAEGDDEIRQLSKPESEVSAGVGYVTKDNRRFGIYNGLNEKGGYLLLDADVARRDDATGTWLRFGARNLGLESRELRFEHNRQGDWGYFIDFSQTPRFNPFDIRTGLQGIGTNTQTVTPVAPGAGALADIKTRRDAFTLGLQKSVGRGWDFQVRFKNEIKEGARMYGQGTIGGAINFLTDPIDYETRQIDAVASYTGDRLQLSGGYYGTDFSNSNIALNVNGGVAGISPMALPPGNQSHQLHLAGGYSLTPTTRATFKMAYATATQTEAFPVTPVVPRTNLDGRVDTTSMQLGVTTKPLPRLSVLANLRYEDRDDKTPIFPYLVTGVTATSTFDGTNEPRSIQTTGGKLEASYGLPAGIRATAGIDYEEKKRSQFRLRSVSSRDKTDETTYRLEARRALGDTVTGAVGYAHSERSGSPFLTNIVNNGTIGSNKIAPLHLADRDRDKVGVTVTWMPVEPLSLQARADIARDDYEARNFENLGLRDGRATLLSLDDGYKLSEAWEANAFAATAENKVRQAVCSSPATGGACTSAITEMTPKHTSTSFGAGVTGTVRAGFKVGAELQYSDFKDQFGLAPTPATGVLPDINTKVTTLRLYTDYALARNSGVRAQWIHDRFKTDDWTWERWTYSDGTRITQPPSQKVDFVGVSYYYRFQ
jgi:MtrB/PioB family decaheme-associated outer membrane protein